MSTSNKTPVKPVRKTASARRWVYGLLVAGTVAVVVGFWFWIAANSGPQSGCDIVISDRNPLDEPTESPKRTSGPNIDCVQLERVSSPEDLQKGLSGRESMAQDRGMLFIFDSSAKWCFWMKDTRFPLDIIWLNEDKRVVHMQEQVQPDSYPTKFCPANSARYVVEVNAGVADKAQLTIGSQLQF